MKIIYRCAVVAACLMASQTATAIEPISYTSLDAGISYADVDENGLDGSSNGFQLRGRLALTRAWFLGLDATWFDDDINSIDYEASEVAGGIGYALRPSEAVSWYAQANLLRVGGQVTIPDIAQVDIDDLGQELRLGARLAPSTRFELEVSYRKQFLDENFEDESFIVASGHYYLTDNVGLGLEGQIGRDSNLATASLRVRF